MAGETVLAIDDREDSLKFLQEYVLEPNGYKVIQGQQWRRWAGNYSFPESRPWSFLIWSCPRWGG